MYLKSGISFPLTYLDSHDQPEQCNQMSKPLNAAEQPSIQPGASERSISPIVQVNSARYVCMTAVRCNGETWIIRRGTQCCSFDTDDDGWDNSSIQ